MKSTIASLRQLTLPFGAQTGQRIVLDGISGRILIYDVNNDLLMEMSPDGFIVYDGNGDTRLSMGTLFEAAYSVLSLWSAAFEETTQGLLSLTDYDKTNRMVLAPGQQSSKGSLEWCLESTAYDNSNPSMLQAVAVTLDDAASPRPIIDLTGASCPAETQYPRTVVYDLWYGMPNQFHEAPDQLQNAPRGIVAFDTLAGPTVLSTTAGTASTLAACNAVPVIEGRRYAITAWYGHSLLTGGSGFAAADNWDFQVDVDEGAGFIAPAPVKPYSRIRQNITPAGACRFQMAPVLGYYDATFTGTVDFRQRAVKVSGAATVTSTVDTNGGASPHTLCIEDIGLAI